MIVVGISDQQVASSPDALITYALGSCVGICIYDHLRKIGGLSHILLPEAYAGCGSGNTYKFADTAIRALVSAMERMGCSPVRMSAKIAGGANMFATGINSIGDRNVETVKRELQSLRIRIIAEDTGADYGRTVEFFPGDGSVLVKTAGRGNRVL